MGALLDQFAADGVHIEASGDGKLRASGKLTDATRAFIRAHKPEILAELVAANDPACNPDVERRRARTLALLDADPGRHIAVLAEAGNSAHIAVAIRGVAVGELTITTEHYDAFALLTLMEHWGVRT